mmetsp:Transcript_22210/g.28811  ORF Transcript_22210/g.28811 Transcript_22210/m.28811 type:complete len:121 (+) Transcript_22210:115-477(+)
MEAGDISWLTANFPDLAARGYVSKFEALVKQYPPDTDLSTWKSQDLVNLITVLGLEGALMEPLTENEFITEDLNEESPISEVDVAELDEILEDCDPVDRDAFKVALRYLKGEFTNVSLRA